MSGRPGERRGMLRGVTLAVLTGLLTAVGHLAGGGTLPDLALLVVLLPLLAGAVVPLAERSRGVTGTIVTLGAGQLALHELIVLLHPAHHPLAPAVTAGGAMVAGHAVATVVAAVAVRHADAAIAAVGAVLRRVVPRRLVPPPADAPLPTLAAAGPAVLLRLARALAVAHVRRGPPVGC